MSDDRNGWDLSQERQFMENLVNNRFNYYMIYFGVILVYAFTCSTSTSVVDRCIILSYGSLISFAIAFGVHRVQVKLTHILRRLHKNQIHPVTLVSKAAAREPFGSHTATWLIGSIIPFGGSFVLLWLSVVQIFEAWGDGTILLRIWPALLGYFGLAPWLAAAIRDINKSKFPEAEEEEPE